MPQGHHKVRKSVLSKTVLILSLSKINTILSVITKRYNSQGEVHAYREVRVRLRAGAQP